MRLQVCCRTNVWHGTWNECTWVDDSKITKGYHSNGFYGMYVTRSVQMGVKEVFSLLDVSSEYPNTDEFTPVANEFNNMLVSLNQIGVGCF